jgi:hypothetical protein
MSEDFGNEEPTRRHPPERRTSSNVSSLALGAVLIIIGIIFLLQQAGDFRLDNWWALFILIPTVGSWATAWRLYRDAGRITRGVRSAFFGGLAPLLVAMIFLFEMDWGKVWPAFLILAGVGALFGALPD